jgi:hypothetical protein
MLRADLCFSVASAFPIALIFSLPGWDCRLDEFSVNRDLLFVNH